MRALNVPHDADNSAVGAEDACARTERTCGFSTTDWHHIVDTQNGFPRP
jgi:hypothetical protein